MSLKARLCIVAALAVAGIPLAGALDHPAAPAVFQADPAPITFPQPVPASTFPPPTSFGAEPANLDAPLPPKPAPTGKAKPAHHMSAFRMITIARLVRRPF